MPHPEASAYPGEEEATVRRTVDQLYESVRTLLKVQESAQWDIRLARMAEDSRRDLVATLDVHFTDDELKSLYQEVQDRFDHVTADYLFYDNTLVVMKREWQILRARIKNILGMTADFPPTHEEIGEQAKVLEDLAYIIKSAKTPARIPRTNEAFGFLSDEDEEII